MKAADVSTVEPRTVNTYIQGGVNTAGTVRVMNLAYLEALVNIGANGTEIFGICWGAGLFLAALLNKAHQGKRFRTALLALVPIACGLYTPTAINWVLSYDRGPNLFS